MCLHSTFKGGPAPFFFVKMAQLNIKIYVKEPKTRFAKVRELCLFYFKTYILPLMAFYDNLVCLIFE